MVYFLFFNVLPQIRISIWVVTGKIYCIVIMRKRIFECKCMHLFWFTFCIFLDCIVFIIINTGTTSLPSFWAVLETINQHLHSFRKQGFFFVEIRDIKSTGLIRDTVTYFEEKPLGIPIGINISLQSKIVLISFGYFVGFFEVAAFKIAVKLQGFFIGRVMTLSCSDDFGGTEVPHLAHIALID